MPGMTRNRFICGAYSEAVPSISSSMVMWARKDTQRRRFLIPPFPGHCRHIRVSGALGATDGADPKRAATWEMVAAMIKLFGDL
ncbi:MAG: hypothetical protein LBU32_12465 [Clostridiales bacterium]|nr:hypothetical protein [Clostridiales bacterium]